MTHEETGNSHALFELAHDFARSEGYEVGARLATAPSGKSQMPVQADFDPALSYGQTRSVFDSQFERRYVTWLLERHHGNISAAAREARMDRKHLHDLAKKHGLREPRGNGRR